ncbi:MAG: penicillin acylase family protein [Gemmatimonadaceae bacterium]|nr:penicillin acylase family protein [Gemmatimonadaceae bacterium]
MPPRPALSRTLPRCALPTRRIAVLAALVVTSAAHAQPRETLTERGLRAPVTLVRDSAGVVHIRAQNEHDLFFAQGWSAARDRLFQLELWRRQATGTLAEVLGPAAIPKDIASRAFRFRGNLARELAHYHPRGAAIITAFVEGINAYIGETEKNVALLSPEFRWLNWLSGGCFGSNFTCSVDIDAANRLFFQRSINLSIVVRDRFSLQGPLLGW